MSGESQSAPHRQRREELMHQLSEGLVLVRGGDRGRLNPNFFYLTGLPEPKGLLILAASGVRIGLGRLHPGPDYQRGRVVQQAIFLPPQDALAARWGEGAAATVESVDAGTLGVDAVLPTTEADAVLSQALQATPALHLVRRAAPSLAGEQDEDASFAARIRHRFLGVLVRDGTARVHAMRQRKDPTEVKAIEQAVRVTAEAFQAVSEALRPGMREHELEAEIARVYRFHGATHAFDPIVGCGENALKLHYGDNSGPVERGRLLLVDSGACLHGYHADVTRTFPVDGTFTTDQRRIYEIVLAAQTETIERCKPGVFLGDLHASAHAVIEAAGYADYFPHGTAHHLGLETHDAGDVHRPLEPGAVVTVEPGIYIPGEGLGIRIEDDVLITEDGCRVLSAAIPKKPDEIEHAIATGR